MSHSADAGGWLDGKPALAIRPPGDARIRPLIVAAAADVEISARSGAGRRVVVGVKHGATRAGITPPSSGRHIAGSAPSLLAPTVVAVFGTHAFACRVTIGKRNGTSPGDERYMAVSFREVT